MAYPNYDRVDEIVRETLDSAGYWKSNGKDEPDNEALKDAVYCRMVEKHVVDDPKQMGKRAVTQQELYAALLPHGPGTTRQPATEEEALARAELKRSLWNFTNTGVTG